MTQRSIQAADTRAAQAALARLPLDDNRYIVIDNSDEDITQILSIICDRSYRGLELVS